MATVVMVVVPVLATRNDQMILSPRSVLLSAFTSVTAADLVRSSVEVWTTGVVVEDDVEVTVVPDGLRPVAVAVLLTKPASTSVCVIVYAVEVQVVEAP